MSLPGLGSKDILGTIIFYHDQQQLAKYLFVASITLLVYDWALNVDLEAAFIWRHSWSWGRVIYHANRAWPIVLLGSTLTVILFLPLPSPSSCKRVSHMYSYGAICQCTIISAMLLLRCWAIYDKKWVVWVLFGGLVGTVVASSVIIKFILDVSSCPLLYPYQLSTIVQLKGTMFLVNPLPSIFSGCIIIIPDYAWILYITALVYESTLFFLTIWRIYILSKEFGTSPLMQTLARKLLTGSGMAYFATLVGLMILACIGGTIPTVKIAANASGVLTAISSVVGSRMIFSLYQITNKERQERQAIADAVGRSETNGGIATQFAIPLQSMASTGVPNNRYSRQA
ncbi:unnamed protein product [Rhizoctonia solani]|uniref:DUF6533 domain-containing protein n=1 Tax=Rhizoctonia solani TaxID=456999 RepID=A0A8H2XW38_9AGAM|nr:unnamed protein product [Rhizoctonia solani]